MDLPSLRRSAGNVWLFGDIPRLPLESGVHGAKFKIYRSAARQHLEGHLRAEEQGLAAEEEI